MAMFSGRFLDTYLAMEVFHAEDLPQAGDSTIRRFNDSTIRRFDDSTRQPVPDTLLWLSMSGRWYLPFLDFV